MDLQKGSLLLLLLMVTSFAFPQEENKSEIEEGSLDGHEFSEDGELLLDGFGSDQNSEPHIVGDAPCQCGVPSRRIAGGVDAAIEEYPWTALLYAVESTRLKIPYCGGTLINNLYVLTASHCVDGMSGQKIEVAILEQNLTSMHSTETNSFRIGVERIISHPDYSRRTLDNDIALIRLKQEVPLLDMRVSPICVPKEGVSFTQGLSATVAGYGATSESETSSSTLQKATVRILSNELCNNDPYHQGKISDNMVCADGLSRGPCKGDTGGGLMVINRNTKSQVLAGLASWSTTCDDPTRPAVYTRVPRYESWIRENTEDADWCGM